MDRKWIMLAPLLGMASAAGAQDGQSANEAVRVFAEAQPGCVVRDVAAVNTANATFVSNGSAGGTITISQLVDPQTAEPRASTIDLSLPVVCNAAHRLVISSTQGGLLRQGGQRGNVLTPNNFADLLPYSIRVDWGELQLAATSTETASLAVDDEARQGELRLRVSTNPGGGALTAGRYDDTITIRFEPAT
jgi:hypothetical protein